MLDELHLLLIHPDEHGTAALRRRFAGLPRVSVRAARIEALREPADAVLTPGNGYGLMSAGFDAAVVARFGAAIESEVQRVILDDFLGEQPVGTAFIVATGDPTLPWLVHAPTMRVPRAIDDTDNVYRATRAAFVALYRRQDSGREPVRRLVLPLMGAGFGRVPDGEAARQMAVAWQTVQDPPYPPTWERVTARHRLISYDGERRLVP